ncbi:MAG: 50S ribosomal protein L17 [SAR86 cluster bacterium]|uniref:Large ribosomal subunit protein bL17 n=1 Tax=SAR86 cluster bacterium TaxID=2030880 RepID=A0A520MU11_9GAMM|nr:MAG: 50S ribosomal protein L17 [SAR86 cluster bacterium]
MRHRKLSRRFSRTSSHRMAMMRNLAASLIEHEVVKTTVEKGKELRRFIEPLITRAKEDTLHNRRQVISELHSKSAASKLFSDLGPRFSETKGGYLRVIKAGFREGDKADICFIELTIRDESESLDQVTESENITKEESNVLEDALVETAVEETKEDKPKKAAAKKTETKEDKPKKAAAKKTETKEDKPKKAAANKAKTKPKKEEEKKSWWSRFKI